MMRRNGNRKQDKIEIQNFKKKRTDNVLADSEQATVMFLITQ